MKPMHIPDGILSPPVWMALDMAVLPAIAVAVHRSKGAVADGRAPLLGVMGAFVFAAQRMNFPVGMGTSGHLLGGALLAMALGPYAATIVLTAILILQALVFQDGGLLALGANVFNMAVIGVWAGWLPFRYLEKTGWRRAGYFAGGFLSVLASAAAAMLEIRLSEIALGQTVVSLSAIFFASTALMEGLITIAVVQAIERLNPGWLQRPAGVPSRAMGILATAAVAMMVGGVLYISTLPDGLESMTELLGIASREHVVWAAPLPDYEARFMAGEWSRKAVAGLAGLGIIYGVCFTVSRLLMRQRSA